MTAPRRVLPGECYLISRRTIMRQFLLRPDDEVVAIYEYCLAVAAARFNITLYAWLAMSNHHHLLIRDNQARFPDFLAYFHKMTAKALNAYWGRSENLWRAEQPSAVRVVDGDELLAKLVYVVANPVADHLVASAEEWGGASSYSLYLTGMSKVVERPAFFRKNGRMPARATLRLERLPGYEGSTDVEYFEKIRCGVRLVEKKARKQRKRHAVPLLTMRGVLTLSHLDAPSAALPTFERRPRIACRDKRRRAEAYRELREFYDAYTTARNAFVGGRRGVVFPVGTFKLRAFTRSAATLEAHRRRPARVESAS